MLMTLEQFIEMCKTRDWKTLIDFLSSNVKDLTTKIVVTAIIGEHHPDKNISQEYGLSVWGKRLSGDPVTPVQSMITGDVDLLDFTNAYLLANTERLLNDQKVATAIADYVEANKMYLALLLESDKVAQENKDKVKEVFGDLSLSKTQKEDYFKKHFALQSKEKIAFIQAADRVKQQMATVLGVEPHTFKVSFNQPSGGGYSISGASGNLVFNTDLPYEELNRFTDRLKNVGINAHLINMRSAYTESGLVQGIQIYTSPVEIDKMLLEWQEKESQLVKTDCMLMN